MLAIEDYQFGRIRIGGREYTRDVIILPDRVFGPWWRADGHVLIPADLDPVRAELPQKLLVGTGYHGRMTVPDATVRTLGESGITVEALPTPEAVERLQSRPQPDQAAALHLTC
jgi:hypothetical protein